MSEIFKLYSEKYFDHNLIVIPVSGKIPLIKQWQKWVYERPDDKIVSEWVKNYPKAGISLICGPSTGLIGVDIDTDDSEIIKKIEDSLPETPVAKTGARGFTLFYRYNGEKFTQTLKTGGAISCEFLFNKHTVLPPSEHPDPKVGHYVWSGDTDFLSIQSLSEIPLIDSSDLTRVSEALKTVSTHQSRYSAKISGRNDRLKARCIRYISQGMDSSKLVSALIEDDRSMHGQNALFEDGLEFHGETRAEINATLFYANLFKSYHSDKKGIVSSPSQSTVSQKEFPNQKTGFFFIDAAGKKKPDYQSLSNYLIDQYGYIFHYEHYVHNGVHYNAISETELERIIRESTLGQADTKSKRAEFISHCKMDGERIAKECLSTEGLINLKNGVLDLKTKKLLPHTKKVLFFSSIPVKYDPEVQCPNWISALRLVFEEDQERIELLRQFFGYILWGGYPFLQKALCLVGEGANGKSMVLEVLKRLIGKDNYSSISMSSIDKPFSAVMLQNKLANIVEESPVGTKINSEAFKNIVGGGEVLMAKKYQDERSETVHARLVFSCNKMPKFQDTSFGLVRRILFLPFNVNLVATGRARPHFFEEALLPELPGILNWILQVLPIQKGFKLHDSSASREFRDLYKEESDSVYAFFKECLEVKEESYYTVDSQVIYDRYKMYCYDSGVNAVSAIHFSRRMISILKEYELNRIQEQTLKGLMPQPEREFRFRRTNLRGFQFLKLN